MPRLILGFDAQRLFNNRTGLGNYSRTLVGNLQRMAPEHSYLLYTKKIGRNPDAQPFTDPAKYRVVTPTGILRSLWRICSIRKNLRTDGVQLFHGLSHDLPFGRKPRGMKYVVTVHDVCFRTFPAMFPLVERIIYHFKYRNALKKADAVVAISQSTKNDILKYFPQTDPRKIEVIYQAIDPLYHLLQPVEQERAVVERYGVRGDYLLYVGSINSRKNLLGVVKAYNRLSPQNRPQLVVVGSGGAYKQEVEAFVQSENLGPYISWLDNVHRTEELRAFYRCARMLVYPSFYEGFGLPVAEALLCQTPVVTSSVSSLPEAGGDCALYADPQSEKQIARAIEQLLADPAFAEESGRRGREFVLRTLDPQRLTQQLLNLYNRLA